MFLDTSENLWSASAVCKAVYVSQYMLDSSWMSLRQVLGTDDGKARF